MSRFWFVGSLLAVALGCTGARAQTDLTFEADTLRPTAASNSALASVPVGKPYTVRVRGLAAAPTWGMKLESVDMSMNFAAGVATFTGTLPAVPPDQRPTLESTGPVFEGGGRTVDLVVQGARPAPIPGVSACVVAPVPQSIRNNPRGNHIVLVMNAAGLPMNRMPTDLDSNDELSFILVIPCAQAERYTITIKGEVADGNLEILGESSLGALAKLRTAGATPVSEGPGASQRPDSVYMGTFGPFKAPSITVTVARSDTTIRTFTMRVLPNYIGAFRAGFGSSGIRFNDFVLSRRASDTLQVVTNRAGDREGRPFVTFVLYAWQVWNNRFWNGRDISEPPRGLSGRLNPFVGVGLRDPTREYMVGWSLEAARGVDIVAARHVAHVNVLANGFTEGAVLTGTDADIPTEKRLRSGWLFGVTADLEAAVNVFQGILGTK
jgi:hypothetical protein